MRAWFDDHGATPPDGVGAICDTSTMLRLGMLTLRDVGADVWQAVRLARAACVDARDECVASSAAVLGAFGKPMSAARSDAEAKIPLGPT
jgi:hypothetical protein